VAAQSTRRPHLSRRNATNNGFLNTDDLLLDITGVTGSITTSSFI
jgi:hypothetical protein